MNKKIKKMLLVIGIISLMTSYVFAATQLSATLATHFTVKLNGNVLNMKDANNNKVYPIVIDGTTYLPVRAISNALGLAVNWDATTNTVLLGENTQYVNLISVSKIAKKYNLEFVTGETNLTFPHIGDTGVKFQNAIKLNAIFGATNTPKITLDKNYSKLNTVLFMNSYEGSNSKVYVNLEDQNGVSILNKTMPPNGIMQINDLNINGVSEIHFKVTTEFTSKQGDFYFANPVVK